MIDVRAYINITDAGADAGEDRYTVWLKVDHQSFRIGVPLTNLDEVNWLVDQLCTALFRMIDQMQTSGHVDDDEATNKVDLEGSRR